jgi:cbb3-type cytochrome oxidase maturation protein
MLEVTFVQFLVALLMGLGALCIFLWAVLSGQFVNVEDVKYDVLRLEVDDDERADGRTGR